MRSIRQRSSRGRRGLTLVELVCSLAAASALLIGLAATVRISLMGFSEVGPSVARAKASEVQADLMADLQSATSFTQATATAAAFTVPDRNGDGAEEAISYSWSELPDAKLLYSLNGSPPAPLLEDVQAFQLNYLTRELTAPSFTPPAMDKSRWGMRWIGAERRLGFDTLFANSANSPNEVIATQAILTETGALKSITARLDSLIGNYRFGLYGSGTSGKEPATLVVQSGLGTAVGSGWLTLAVPETLLEPGSYWLALSYDNVSQKHAYNANGGTTFIGRHNTVNSFTSSFPPGSKKYSYQVSIYGTYTPAQ